MQVNEARPGILLIGMPGAGKSTIGVLLAKECGLDFVDTDILIQVQAGRTLQTIVDTSGADAMRQLEENVLLQLDSAGKVVASGGSAVYSEAAMARLHLTTQVIWLRASLEELRQRLDNFDQRGIVRRPGQTLEQLFSERNALYQRHADLIVDAGRCTPAEVVADIMAHLSAR